MKAMIAMIPRTNMTIPSINNLFANLGSSFRTAKYAMIPPRMLKKNGTMYQALVGRAALYVASVVGGTVGCTGDFVVFEAPHVGQKAPSSGSCAPHLAQYTIVLIQQLA